jgi:uncharacterized protein
MVFVNRKRELNHLEKEYSTNNFSFIVIYGRRRIGKTRLIEEFIKNKKAIYYLASQESDLQQINEFKILIANELNDLFLKENIFKSWPLLFSYLEKTWPKKEKIILVLDEITYIIKQNPSFISYLQKFLDSFLSKTNTCLILSGSLVGLLIESVLSYNSPLYGRRTSQIHLEEFTFKDSLEFMKNKNIQEQIEFYSVTGGVAKYLLFIDKDENFKDFLLNKVLNKEGFFSKEGIFFLSQEFKEPATYLNILKAISFGNSKLNEISNYTGLEGKKISSYLDILINLGIIKKEIPITEYEFKFRGAIYKLKDNFLKFWHRFIYVNRSYIEIGKEKELYNKISKDINANLGFVFEDICKQFLKNDYLNYKLGTWWGSYRENNIRKTVEIDIVAINNKEILFCECKYKDNVDAEKIYNELKEKSKHVKWNNENRIEHFAIFAKSFKNKIKKENLILYDLKDIEKSLK